MVYNDALKAIDPKEREDVMQWTNEWIEQGIQQGQRQLTLRMLGYRLGPAATTLADEVARLSDAQISELAEALLNFKDLDDARSWLACH